MGTVRSLLYVKKYALFGVVFFATLVSFSPHTSFDVAAQTIGQEGISLSVSPRFPKENAQVAARVESFSTDLNRASISWTVSGRKVAEGMGVTTASFTTESLGKETRITATITTEEGEVVTKSLVIVPAEVDLVYEARGYTHPFYQGKTLLPVSAQVRVSAIPHVKSASGSLLSPRNLVYTWSEGTRVLGSLSGTGKDSITIAGPEVYRTKTISVEVSSLDGSRKAKRTIDIKPENPRVLLYENHPLLGIMFERAFTGTLTFEGEELSLLALPFFFSQTNRADEEVALTWRINNERAEPGVDRGILTLRPEGSGVARVSVSAKGVTNYLEQASTEATLNF